MVVCKLSKTFQATQLRCQMRQDQCTDALAGQLAAGVAVLGGVR